jgi:hypothetical protein
MGKNKLSLYLNYNYFDRHNTENHNVSVIVFHFVMLKVVLLNGIMLSVLMLSAVTLSVMNLGTIRPACGNNSVAD